MWLDSQRLPAVVVAVGSFVCVGALTSPESAVCSDVNCSATDPLYVLISMLQFCWIYSQHIAVVMVLGALTVFRREMSCNHVYEDGSSQVPQSPTATTSRAAYSSPSEASATAAATERLIQEAGGSDLDSMLGKAGNLMSGGPMLAEFVAVCSRLVFDVAATATTAGTPLDRPRCLSGASRVSSRTRGDGTVKCVTETPADRGGERPNDAADTDNDGDAYCDAGTKSSLSGGCLFTLDPKAAEGRGDTETGVGHCGSLLFRVIPSDAQIHMLSFLHPRDVVTFACVSHEARTLVDGEGLEQNHDSADSRIAGNYSGRISRNLWTALWKRDYAWILTDWDVGRDALQRSATMASFLPVQDAQQDAEIVLKEEQQTWDLLRHLSLTSKSDNAVPEGGSSRSFEGQGNDAYTMKDVYFGFAASWLNYSLAGHNTTQRCLVGLHGHVFDISSFVDAHPGSPEILHVQSGKDATAFFEDMGHSVAARKMARGFCVVADAACLDPSGALPDTNCDDTGMSGRSRRLVVLGGWGLKRPNGVATSYRWATPRERFESTVATEAARRQLITALLPMVRSRPRKAGNLQLVRNRLQRDEILAQMRADDWLARRGPGREGILGNIKVYYDPFRRRYMAWYNDFELLPHFVDCCASFVSSCR